MPTENNDDLQANGMAGSGPVDSESRDQASDSSDLQQKSNTGVR